MRMIFRRKTRGATFQHPLDPAPRTAILAPGFSESGRIRAFPQGWTEAAKRFQPTCIAGSMQVLRGLVPLHLNLQHAVIVFTDLSARLTEQDRDLLWQGFGVPVFEQCLGSDNQLMASECEAHDGIHIWQAASSQGEVERDKCACGSEVPRLRKQMALAAVA